MWSLHLPNKDGESQIHDIAQQLFGQALKAEAALRVVAPLLSAPVADRTNWTLARLAGEVEKKEGVTISLSQLSKVLRKKGGIATAGHDTR